MGKVVPYHLPYRRAKKRLLARRASSAVVLFTPCHDFKRTVRQWPLQLERFLWRCCHPYSVLNPHNISLAKKRTGEHVAQLIKGERLFQDILVTVTILHIGEAVAG